MTKQKWALVAAIVILVVCFFKFGWRDYFTLDYLKSQQAAFNAYYEEHPVTTLGAYFIIYVVTTALSLPGAATIMTLAGGMMFGFWVGLIVVSFASTLGATCAFLVARTLLRDNVQRRFADNLVAVNRGFAEEGAFYLFTMRLMPIFPFFIVNLVMGLTPIATRTFFFVSQIGMLPGTAVYVNAGTQLSRIDTLKGILSPNLILSFMLLGIFPLLVKKCVSFVQKRQKR